ncbi:MAG: hypothetical protein KF775_03980 [Cyclobacteriaceae bacterium]|nr:hypothetical protein [Cyclobacteriaceae bacterium]
MKLTGRLLVGFALLMFACAEDPQLNRESELLGFWEYQTMTVNNQVKEFSNFLNISEDKTYDQCYLTGEWKLKGDRLELKFGGRVKSYQIVHLSSTRLVLKTSAVNGNDYNYSDIPEGTRLTIVQELSKK